MKLKSAIIITLCLIVSFSASSQTNTEIDSTKSYLYLPIDVVRKIYIKQDSLKTLVLKYQDLVELQKKALKLSMKIDTVQTHVNQKAIEVVKIQTLDLKTVQKKLIKNKLQDFWRHTSDYLLFIGGFILGTVITIKII